jgi:hypothetical protein
MTQAFAGFPVPEIDDTVDIRDFTIKQKRLGFRLDDDVFYAYAILGMPLMQEMIQASKSLKDLEGEEKFDGVVDIFDKLLYPESAVLFKKRLQSLGDNAVDVKRQLIPILHYLLEAYGVRPTQLSSDSSTGLSSETDGTTSTVGQPNVESIQLNSSLAGS